MEREHLIIIALILVALYMMNSSSSDKVKAIGPAGRIRYTDAPQGIDGPLGHIRTRREGYEIGGTETMPERIRLGDRDYGKGHFIKGHIRHNNRNNMFSGMMGSGCGESTMMPPKMQMPMVEKFRMEGCGGQMKPMMNIRREGFELDCSNPCNPGCGTPC